MNTLSIVFQGPAGQNGELSAEVRQNLLRTRAAFPQAELIVSTWHYSPAADKALHNKLRALDITLVLSHDPGPIIATDSSGRYITNLNRMLVSARAGLAAASRPLAVKLRTDTWLSGRKLADLLRRHVLDEAEPVREVEFRIFKSRVINVCWFARDARGSLPYLYHPGDILLAGRTEDVRLFFSAPLADKGLFRPARMAGLWSAWRYVPEQWCWINAIYHATGRRVFAGNFDYSPAQLAKSERYFLANFVPYRPRQLNFHWPKYWRRYPFRGLFSTVTPARWRRMASRYQGGVTYSLLSHVDEVLTAVWRAGYCLRAKLMSIRNIRKLLMFLFFHRN